MSRVETPAEFFNRTKASQWQALKMLGHSPSRVEELRKLNQRSEDAQDARSSTTNRRNRQR